MTSQTARTGRRRRPPYDLAIVGSGGAAFAVVIRARKRGARVVMIERGAISGTCVNIDCVPSKTLLCGQGPRGNQRPAEAIWLSRAISWKIDWQSKSGRTISSGPGEFT
jgi:pyruvate/2-oxoglutarate dehydrogenase complex dihydrolipoamide dehydrogenase (E3) component